MLIVFEQILIFSRNATFARGNDFETVKILSLLTFIQCHQLSLLFTSVYTLNLK